MLFFIVFEKVRNTVKNIEIVQNVQTPPKIPRNEKVQKHEICDF